MELSKQEIEQLLKEAEKAHGEFEKTLGRRDEDWPAWYADFIYKKINN